MVTSTENIGLLVHFDSIEPEAPEEATFFGIKLILTVVVLFRNNEAI